MLVTNIEHEMSWWQATYVDDGLVDGLVRKLSPILIHQHHGQGRSILGCSWSVCYAISCEIVVLI